MLTDQPGKDTWPITGATFILMYKAQDKPANAANSLKFFDWAYANGDKMADDLEYVPLPAAGQGAGAQVVGGEHQGHGGQAGRLAVELTAVRSGRPRDVRNAGRVPAVRRPAGENPGRHERPPARRCVAPLPWADLLFSVLAHGAAWLTLALLAGIIVSLRDRRGAGDPGIRTFVPVDAANGIRCRTAMAAW